MTTTADDIAELFAAIRDLQAEVSELQADEPIGPASVEAVFVDASDLQGWVDNTLQPMLTELASATEYPAWCTEWHLHPLIAWMFETAYLAWSEIEDTPSRTKWMGDVLLPLRSVICSPDGPFTLCKTSHHGQAIQMKLHLNEKGPHRPEVTRRGTEPATELATSAEPPDSKRHHAVFTAAVERVTRG